MEINIENAFRIFVKLSISPFIGSYDGISKKFGKRSNQFLAAILQRPLTTTMISTFLLILLLSILIVPIMALMAVLCIVVVIVIIEGFILGVILTLTAVVTTIKIGLFSLLLGFKIVYRDRD